MLPLLEIVESPLEIVSHFRKSLRARLVKSIAYQPGNDRGNKRTIRPIGIMLRMHLTDFGKVWNTQIAKLVTTRNCSIVVTRSVCENRL